MTITAFVDRLLENVEKMPQLPLLWSREILNAGGLLRERVMPFVPLDRFEAVRRSFAEAQQDGRLNAAITPGLVLTSVMAVVMLPLVAQVIFDKNPFIPAIDKAMLKRHALALLLDGLCPERKAPGRTLEKRQ